MSTVDSFDSALDHIDLMAAEYVVGVLDADGRRRARQRIEREPDFAHDVQRWESWFTPWLESLAPVEAPPATWSRISATLWRHTLAERKPAAPPARVPLWDRLGFWRGLGTGGVAVALVSVIALMLNLRGPPGAPTPTSPPVAVAPPPAPAPMVLALRHEDGSTAYTAMLDPVRGRMVLVPVQLGGDPALSPELWLIPAGGKPHSLGMVKRGEPMVVDIPANLRGAARSDAVFAISLEPAGSQPHASPTGPVIAKGSIVTL